VFRSKKKTKKHNTKQQKPPKKTAKPNTTKTNPKNVVLGQIKENANVGSYK